MQLTKNFSAQELACPCCGDVKMNTAFLEMLQTLRDRFGQAIRINSAFRCVKHNAAIGGENGSYHLKGCAADVNISKLMGADKYRLLQFIIDMGFGGVGLATTFYHIDNRSGQKVVWTY